MLDQEEFKKNLRQMNLSEKQNRDLIVNLSREKPECRFSVCKPFNTQSDYLGASCLNCKKKLWLAVDLVE
jgi:flagellar assembly factor FliW